MTAEQSHAPELAPCPFCGERGYTGALGQTHARCLNHECAIHGIHIAPAKWNTRAPSAAAPLITDDMVERAHAAFAQARAEVHRTQRPPGGEVELFAMGIDAGIRAALLSTLSPAPQPTDAEKK